MISVAICGNLHKSLGLCDSAETVEIEGLPIAFGLIETVKPTYNSKAFENRSTVLIEVRSFSCNYRDKALILSYGQRCRDSAYYFIGSEFVGEVVAVGSEVTGFQVGDRVMPNSQYPESGVSGLPPGVSTNHASQRYRAVHEAKLIKVPQKMSDEVAGAFSMAAQTTYSMLRKLNLTKGTNVLVTAAKSNTSLFAINALKKYHVNVYATTTSMQFERELTEMGVKELIPIDPALESFRNNEIIKDIVSKTVGFDCVIDPFFDLHIGKVIDIMAPNSRYVTCGLYDQYSSLIGKDFNYRGRNLSEIMTRAIVNNVQIIGNCLGQKEDLQDAIEDYVSGSLDVVIDSVFSGHQVGTFFNRTYNARDRFGKVVYRYDEV
jgi:NADPH:quinone reductase-like Zn-dependent oxidoreductase